MAALADELEVDRRGSAIRCPMPDHDDDDYSAGIFLATKAGAPHGRWKCHAGCLNAYHEPKTGDATELVLLALEVDFAAACRWLDDWLDEQPTAPPSPPDRPGLAERDRAWVRRGLELPRRSERVARRFFIAKGMDVDPAWAVAERLVCVGKERSASRDALLMPWFAMPVGKAGRQALVGVTKRYRTRHGWAKTSLKGSRRRGYFYGEHRDQGRRWVVLCEGETDALVVAWWLRTRPVDVLGVAGAGADLTDRMAARLAGRRVVLLPDGDRAGAEWAQRWDATLAQIGCAGRSVARVGVGADAVAAGRRRVLVALRAAKRQ